MGEQAKRPIDKKLGGPGQAPHRPEVGGNRPSAPSTRSWGEQAKRPIDKKSRLAQELLLQCLVQALSARSKRPEEDLQMRKSASEGQASSRHSDGLGADGSPPCESAQTQEQGERALVQGIVQGDRVAWQRFVCDYSETLRFSILNTLRRFSAAAPPELVEDLEAELHCRLCEHGFRRLAAFRGDSSLRQWLKVVAANAVIDHLRARRPSVSLESLEEAGTELPDSSASPEEVFARQELEQAVERLFAQLGDEDT
ncbi:MAG: hypothetical protein RBU37_07740, partial [Myxococcota bacterium]|nr:hypothetical protein [Myxococcota bacterium]